MKVATEMTYSRRDCTFRAGPKAVFASPEKVWNTTDIANGIDTSSNPLTRMKYMFPDTEISRRFVLRLFLKGKIAKTFAYTAITAGRTTVRYLIRKFILESDSLAILKITAHNAH